MVPQFIAEVSSNHHKDLERCLTFIDTASEIGCSAVKFQLFKVSELFAPEILNKSKEHRQRAEWELPVDFLPHLSQRCRKQGIKFACTPFYLDAVTELLPYVDFFKIASYELLWHNLLAECATTGKPVVLSTGMATLKEIEAAVTILRDSGCTELSLLHCISDYPTPISHCNLAAIDTLRKTFQCPTGWSDHSVEPSVIFRAVHQWNASIIEFHLDLDGKGEEFSSGHCWLPDKIKQIINTTRNGFQADGNGLKVPTANEVPERAWRADPKDGLRPFKEMRN